MNSSNQPGRKSESTGILKKNLENIGIQEIGIWKEMVLRDDALFSEIYSLIYCDNPRIAWHAAWVTDHVSEADPKKLEAYVPEMIDHLPNLTSSSLKRHFTRMFLSQKIPESRLGKMVDTLYDLLSPSEVPKITGAFIFAATSAIPSNCVKSEKLNCPMANFSCCAFFK